MLKEGDYERLTGANVKWESDQHYRAMLEFAMACCEFMDNVGDMEFINTLPMTMEEFHQQAPTIKDRYILIVKSHIAHFDTYPDKIFEVPDRLSEAEQRIASLQRIGSELPEEVETIKSSLMHKPPLEDISKTKEKYSVRYKEPEPDVEKSVMVEKILHLSKEKKKLKTALKHLRHKPTQMEMKVIIDRNRFKSGKCNNTKVGKELAIDGETALAWIKKLGLSDYAYNPKNLKQL